MPRNGSGTYTLPPSNPTIPGTVISSGGWWNPTSNDIATAITQSLAYDGQTVPIADLPMGNFKHTAVGNANQRNQYSAYGQVQDGQPQWMTVTGTDTILATIAPGPTTYTAGQTFRFVVAGANTTNAVTLNINSLGAKAVTKTGAIALSAGDIVAGQVLEVIYDGTQFQILSVMRARGTFSVRGLLGLNNSGVPNTRYDVTATYITLFSPTTGEILTRPSGVTLTNDITVAGPAINGRDQAGVFAAGSWIYLYYIWNGSTLATITSLQNPGTGPTMPTGYTHWAFATSLRMDASSFILRCYTRGSQVIYDLASGAANRILATGTASTMTAVSAAVVVPPIALTVLFNFELTITHPTAGTQILAKVRPTGSAITGINAGVGVTPVNGVQFSTFNAIEFIVGPTLQIDYTVNPNTYSSGGFSIDVLGYTIPNGDA